MPKNNKAKKPKAPAQTPQPIQPAKWEYKVFGWAKTDIKQGEYVAVNPHTGETVITTKEEMEKYNLELKARIAADAARKTQIENAVKVMMPNKPKIIT